MILQRKFKIQEFYFPKDTCSLLHEITMKNAKNYDRGAIMTDFFFNPFLSIAEWFAKKMREQDNVPEKLIVKNVFGQYYDIGHYQVPHDHKPNHWSMVLFTNAPEGSSDLCFDDVSVKAETGKAVVFPGDVLHHVPENKGKNRSVIVCNLQYEI